MANRDRLILVTGATGYVGGRLVPRLLAEGYKVRCIVRDPNRLDARRWEGVEVVRGDVLNTASLHKALCDVTDAYYLIHSMTQGEGRFEDRDRMAAEHFGMAASAAGVRRIIYLGGLGKAEGFGDARGDLLRENAELGADHLALFHELPHDGAGHVDRDGESDSRALGRSARRDRHVHSDDFPVNIRQGTSAVAGIDGGVGLNQVAELGSRIRA